MPENKVELIVPEYLFGNRADHVISLLLNDYSRSRIKQWIEKGFVLVENEIITPKQKMLTGQKITVYIQPEEKELQFQPEHIKLDVIYSDNDIAVINKPSGLVVHPAEGNWTGTLLNGILDIFPDNKLLPRAGIVHRLDKETSGLLVIALNEISQLNLIKQLQAKTVYREYRAIVCGNIISNGLVDEPIGRHPKNRVKMCVNKLNGKHAVTKYEPIEVFQHHTYLKCILETGRTHQIRVHMQYIGRPLVGDPMYGFKKIFPFKGMPKKFIDLVVNFPRQALHAKKLGLVHPTTNKKMHWDIKLPDDFSDLLNVMRSAPLMDNEFDISSYTSNDYEDTIDDESFEDFDLDDN
jgi:23S rRNA pseudouridine1911/1915/1917 synthase